MRTSSDTILSLAGNLTSCAIAFLKISNNRLRIANLICPLNFVYIWLLDREAINTSHHRLIALGQETQNRDGRLPPQVT